ncbi:MAG: hypothetical protein IKU19_03945, partial [Clostridia bacterium]|nr:hypothetical protein [Clostridia bacterium]
TSFGDYVFTFGHDSGDAVKNRQVVIKCYENSTAHRYAVNNGLNYKLLGLHEFTNYITVAPTCTQDGYRYAFCDCSCGDKDVIINYGSALGHSYTKYMTHPASCTEDEKRIADCDNGCGSKDIIVIEGSAPGHSFTEYRIYLPTCAEDWKNIAYCDNGCGAYDVEYMEGTAYGHIWSEYEDNTAATCTEDATLITYCERGCGDEEIVVVEETALGHTWSEWIRTVEPTYFAEGEELKYCTVCDYSEVRSVPVLDYPYKPVISVDNLTVTMTNAEYIKDMRYAVGTYTTTTEIRNAVGNVALSESVVTANTVDGNFVYKMPVGGYYSIWIRMKNGINYILPLDVTKVDACVSVEGVKITVSDIYDIKDYFIAKGEFYTYNQIKQNGYIVSISETKIAGRSSYTYTVNEPGLHTVLIRYHDGRTDVVHKMLEVDQPKISVNGLQVTVSNLPDVKVIRTAYGEYNTPGDTKRASGARNYSSKVIKGADDYMIQYRENGTVTVVVEYNNGYVEIFHVDIQMKQAKCIRNGGTVVFDNLDGFKVIRYAKGAYNTSAEIKRASGSAVIKPADLGEDGRAIISGLKAGTYTFCVQFDDESYNYYRVVVE